MSRGILIAIEGPKAAGKSSLIARLRRFETCSSWLFTKEPTEQFNLDNEEHHAGSDLAKLIRDDRDYHVRDIVTPALNDGRVVVTDRYVLSGLVFQSIDGVQLDDLLADNSSFPRPDITMILVASSAELRRRKESLGLTTRISELIEEERESQLYIEYANLCRRDVNKERVIIGYNESWPDCGENVRNILNAAAITPE